MSMSRHTNDGESLAFSRSSAFWCWMNHCPICVKQFVFVEMLKNSFFYAKNRHIDITHFCSLPASIRKTWYVYI